MTPTATPNARLSLRLELMATLAILLMMAVVSLSLASELLGERRHTRQQQRQLGQHVNGLVLLITPRLGQGTTAAILRSDVEQTLRASMGNLGIEAIEVVRVLDTQTQPLLALGLPPELPNPAPATQVTPQRIWEHRGLVVVDHTLRNFGSSRGGGDLVLRVVSRPDPWTRIQDWQQLVVLAVGVGLVMLVLGIGLLELQVLRPLARVRSAVGQLAAGDLDAKVPEEGPTELRSLAGAFNTMTQALDQRAQQVEAQRALLIRAERLASVGRVSAGVAHEIGNPLAALLGYVELLLDPRGDGDLSKEQLTLLTRSRQQILRIQDTVHQLLDCSRPSQNKPVPLPAVTAATGALTLLRHDPRCHQVDLDASGDAELTVLADPTQLDQILQNLVINAARAAQDPKRVHIFVEHEGDDIRFDVQDTGAGVDEEHRERLFEPFFTTSAAGEGTGLGLAISQGLAEGMNGSLQCLRAGAREPMAGAKRSGAVFRLTLPRAPTPAPELPPAKELEEQAPSSGEVAAEPTSNVDASPASKLTN